MRCRAVHARLVAYRDGELAPGEAVRVEEHLAGCPDCRVLDERLVAATPAPFAVLPPLSAEAELALSRALDEVDVEPPRMELGPDLDWTRLRTHLAWAAAVLLCLGWGLSNYQHAQALQAQLDRAPAPATTVLDGDDFRPASWSPPETEAEPGD